MDFKLHGNDKYFTGLNSTYVWNNKAEIVKFIQNIYSKPSTVCTFIVYI